MKFKVSRGLFKGRTYSTWEDCIEDSQEGEITVEMTGDEYVQLNNDYIDKINSMIEENQWLKEIIEKKDHEYSKKTKDLKEKDRRCAALASAVNRLKKKAGVSK